MKCFKLTKIKKKIMKNLENQITKIYCEIDDHFELMTYFMNNNDSAGESEQLTKIFRLQDQITKLENK